MEQTETKHNPDVLECLANLSNDEVFTPPRVANAMLDLLPQELFRNPKTTFLDPCCKSGVFLREIAKRLIVGLEPVFPDLQERLDHIFHKQLFGFAITELTALTSRRTVYCTKSANGEYSISHFDTPEGNILLPLAKHQWIDGKCRLCGASEETLKDRTESHAYAFIHGINPEKVFHMKFDVIIGNPPYQLADGGAQASARPIYHLFVEQAKLLKPKFIVFITPARWYAGGKGLDEFRDDMLGDTRITELHDYTDSSLCFPGVKIEGGVSYFLWERDRDDLCHIVTRMGKDKIIEGKRRLREPGMDVFIRYQQGYEVWRKVKAYKEASFEKLVSARKPFGLESNFKGLREKARSNDVKVYANKAVGFLARYEITKAVDVIGKWKVFISYAYGMGDALPYQVLNKPFLGEPNSCCTETYLYLGPFKTKEEAENVISYIKTRFFRFLVLLRKMTQHATAKVYASVPQQDFSKPLTDEELYAKYGLTDEEIAFIESMVKPMEV